MPEDLNRKILSLDILVGQIPGGEIFFCTTPETTQQRKITVHVEGAEGFSLTITKENQNVSLFQLLETTLGTLQRFTSAHFPELPKDDMAVETPAGVALALEILLKDIPEDVEVLSLVCKNKTDVVCRT